MVNIAGLTATYEWRFAHMKIMPNRQHEVDQVAKRLVDQRAKMSYLNIENLTGVPWWEVALIHEREASQQWWANIANGEPWNRVTKMVPRGRGPFKSWQEAAIDALTKCPLYTLRSVNSWKDWSAGGALVLTEMYNGFGYETFHHENSPYVWAATTFEQEGKYVQDHVWRPGVWDQQLGTAAMLYRMHELDTSITFTSTKPTSPSPTV